jgi:iron(III) transport system ATP-binding protein
VGITTVFVTHDQDEALSMSDRIVVMDHGVVRQVGEPQTIYDAPVDLFVADFIGTINLVAGRILSDSERCTEVAVPGHPTPLRARRAVPGALSGPAMVAIRPEAIFVDPPSDALQDINLVTAPVIDRTYLGDHQRYRVRLGDSVLTVQTSVAARADELTLGLPVGRTLVFAGGEAPASVKEATGA